MLQDKQDEQGYVETTGLQTPNHEEHTGTAAVTKSPPAQMLLCHISPFSKLIISTVNVYTFKFVLIEN